MLLSKSITVGGEMWQKTSADAALFSVTPLDGDFSMAKIFVIWPSSLRQMTHLQQAEVPTDGAAR